MDRVNELMREIAAETDRQVAEIGKASFFNSPAKEKKRVINDFASFLKRKAMNLKQEAQIGRENFSRYSTVLITLADQQRHDSDAEQYKAGVAQFLATAETVLSALPENRKAIAGFRNAVESLPRITIQFDQSKKILIEAIDECSSLFDETERAIFEIAGRT